MPKLSAVLFAIGLAATSGVAIELSCKVPFLVSPVHGFSLVPAVSIIAAFAYIRLVLPFYAETPPAATAEISIMGASGILLSFWIAAHFIYVGGILLVANKPIAYQAGTILYLILLLAGLHAVLLFNLSKHGAVRSLYLYFGKLSLAPTVVGLVMPFLRAFV